MADGWAYKTPLEEVPEGVTLDPRVIEINGMPFQARSDCEYKFDYYRLMNLVEKSRNLSEAERKENPAFNELNLYHNVILIDLWFLVYFVCKNPLANHPFIVGACREIEEERGDTLEEWARDHLKTTIISCARQIQKVLNDPERRIAIFSAVRPLAVKIQNLIRNILEQAFLVKCFPAILYEDPYKDAEKWTEAPEGGLIVKRSGFHKEPTFASYGLVEGMPAGPHHTDLVYDDIVTQEYNTPDIMEKICNNFELSWNLGSRGAQKTVVGTPYRHDDPLSYIRELKEPVTGRKLFKNRKKPATVDGEYNCASVFLHEYELAKKRAGKVYFFFCQQLVNPTPRGMTKFNKDRLYAVSKQKLPSTLYKFMLIDPSGDKGRRLDRAADAWAMGVIGVEPFRDDKGASRIFILDLIIEEMSLAQAQRKAVEMYCRNGRIIKLGIEKVGQSTAEIHIASSLRARRKFVSIETGNLVILKTAGRSKQFRIEDALSLPFENGKVHYLDTIPAAYIERLKMEMDKFPAWKDDGLDMLSYTYDIIKDYKFPDLPPESLEEKAYDAAFRKARETMKGGSGWQSV